MEPVVESFALVVEEEEEAAATPTGTEDRDATPRLDVVEFRCLRRDAGTFLGRRGDFRGLIARFNDGELLVGSWESSESS